MNESIVPHAVITKQALNAARHFKKTGIKPSSLYCAHFEPEHHAEFSRGYYSALQRMTTSTESEAPK
jgi:hypothetical protein